MKRLIITGDSHTVAIAAGLQEAIAEGQRFATPVSALKLYSSPLSLSAFFDFDGSVISFGDEGVRQALKELTDRETISAADDEIVFALSVGFSTTKLVRRPDWQTFAPWTAADRRGRHFVSEGVVERIALAHFRHAIAFYGAMTDLGLRVLAVDAPPVRADDVSITLGADPEVVMTVDALARRAVRAELEARGVTVVHAPAEARDAKGFLRPDLANMQKDDHHHANAAYGRLMLGRIIDQATADFGTSS